MFAGVPFDIGAGQLTATDVARLVGVQRPVIDTVLAREQLAPTRRGTSGHKKTKGRPLLSFEDALQLSLMRTVSTLGIPMSKSSEPLAPVNMKFTGPKAAVDLMAKMSEVARSPGWTWAMARSIERGKPFFIYAYVTRQKGDWRYDMHVENPGTEKPREPPCFGWDVPHIYVPVGEIFAAVYNDCKELLGVSGQGVTGKDV
jgi:hypothetical protein